MIKITNGDDILVILTMMRKSQKFLSDDETATTNAVVDDDNDDYGDGYKNESENPDEQKTQIVNYDFAEQCLG